MDDRRSRPGPNSSVSRRGGPPPRPSRGPAPPSNGRPGTRDSGTMRHPPNRPPSASGVIRRPDARRDAARTSRQPAPSSQLSKPRVDNLLSDNDFPANDDKLGFSKAAQGLANYLERSEPPLAIALDGARGSGRSTYSQFVARTLEPSTALMPLWVDAPSYTKHQSLFGPILAQISREFGATPDLAECVSRFATDYQILENAWPALLKIDTANLAFDALQKKVDSRISPLPNGNDGFLVVERLQDTFLQFVQTAAAKMQKRAFVVFVDDLDHCDSSVIERFLFELFTFSAIPGSRVFWCLSMDIERFVKGNRNRLQALLSKTCSLTIRVPTTNALRALLTQHVAALGLHEVKANLNAVIDIIEETGLSNPRMAKRIVSRLSYIMSFGSFPRGATEAQLLYILACIREVYPRIFEKFRKDPNASLQVMASTGNSYGNTNYNSSNLSTMLKPFQDPCEEELTDLCFQRMLGIAGQKSMKAFNLRTGNVTEASKKFIELINKVDSIFG